MQVTEEMQALSAVRFICPAFHITTFDMRPLITIFSVKAPYMVLSFSNPLMVETDLHGNREEKAGVR